ncbi:unnamed protein product [Absidia cylindrospora]
MSSANDNTLLTFAQKATLQDMFENLDMAKMWHLSTGTIVEKQMEKLAMACIYEHSCHSLVIDTEDPMYDDYFTAEELNEIQTHNAAPLPDLPVNINQCLTDLQSASTPDECRTIVLHGQPFDVDYAWIQEAILNTSSLFPKLTSVMNFRILSKTDLLMGPFKFIPSTFISSMVDARSGKWTIGWNHKVDMLFRSSSVELGCLVLEEDVLQQSKVLKDMLYRLAQQRQVNDDLRTVGLTLKGPKLTMMVMDSPSSYVGRLKKIGPLYFPNNTKEVTNSIPQLLRLSWTAKMIMEATLLSFSTSESHSSTLTFNNRHAEPSCLLQPSFPVSSYSSSTSLAPPSSDSDYTDSDSDSS